MAWLWHRSRLCTRIWYKSITSFKFRGNYQNSIWFIKSKKVFFKRTSTCKKTTAHPGSAEHFSSKWLLPRLASIKHPRFAEENEWRLLKQIHSLDLLETDYSVQFRPSAMGPTPYLSIPFPPEALQEIIIGPGNHSETRKAAVINMLNYHKLNHVKIKISNIAFRR